MQLVKAIMSEGVISLDIASSTLDAAKKMREQDIGFLCLTKDGQELAGCVTDRDLVLGPLASGRGDRSRLSEFANNKVITISPEAPVEDAIALMQKHKTQRILVTDEKSKPVGVIALSDLADKCDDKGLVIDLLINVKEPRH